MKSTIRLRFRWDELAVFVLVAPLVLAAALVIWDNLSNDPVQTTLLFVVGLTLFVALLARRLLLTHWEIRVQVDGQEGTLRIEKIRLFRGTWTTVQLKDVQAIHLAQYDGEEHQGFGEYDFGTQRVTWWTVSILVMGQARTTKVVIERGDEYHMRRLAAALSRLAGVEVAESAT